MSRNFCWIKPAPYLLPVLLFAALLLSGCPDPTNQTPQPPEKPVIASVLSGNGSLTVNWETVSGAASYEVYHNTSNTTTGAAQTGSITGTTATITGLTNGTTYHVWVKAKNNGGSSGYSEAASETPRAADIEALTLPDGWYKGRALPPYDDGYDRTGETITYYGNGSKDINFAGRALKYSNDVIVIQVSKTNEWGPPVGKYYGVYMGGATPFSFTGANAYKQDSAYNNGMDTLEAAVAEYTDTGGYFGMKADYGLYAGTSTVTADGTAGLNVSWTAVPGTTSGYDLCYSISAGTGDLPTSTTTANVSITSTAASITDLTDLKPHHIWVRPKGASNTGAWVYQGSAEPNIIPANLGKYFQSLPYSAEYAFYDDGFTVDSSAKTFYYYGDSTFEKKWGGPIVKIVPETGSEPNIVIVEITNVEGDWYTSPVTGKYFAFAYKNLTDSGVSQCTAYKMTGGQNTGVDTIGEAVSEYTAANGYYPASLPLYYTHTTSAVTLASLQGKWVTTAVTEDPDYFIHIRGTKLTEWLDNGDGVYDATDDSSMLGELGDIVDHTDTGQTSGVLYVKIIASDTGFTADKYIAVAWKNKTASGISFMTHTTEYGSIAEVKAALNNAADTSQFPGNGFYAYAK